MATPNKKQILATVKALSPTELNMTWSPDPDPIARMHASLSKGLAHLRRAAPQKRLPVPTPPPPAAEVRSGRSCHRKTPYMSAQEATESLDECEANNPGLKLYLYKCSTCHRWHLTKSKQ